MTVSHSDREKFVELLAGKASGSESRSTVHSLIATRLAGEDGRPPRSGRRKAGRFSASTYSVDGYERAFSRSTSGVEQHAGSLASERELAGKAMLDLLALPAAARSTAVRSCSRFQSWALCDLLVEECHRTIYAEAAGADRLADLAVNVAEELDVSHYGSGLTHDLRARAWAAVGEALRVLSDLRGAEEAFVVAETLLELGTGDPLEKAWLKELKACLRRDQWRTAEADRFLDEAIATYRRYRDLHRVGRAYIHKGRLYGQVHEFEPAILWLQRGLALIEPAREAGLELAARHGLMLLLHESGRHREAWLMLRASQGEFVAHGGELLVLRLRWLEGKLQQALGNRQEAERTLRAARGGFIRQGIGFDAALVSLDLARLYAGLGRAAEVKELAEEMLPIFESRDLHREAIAALIVFRQAVQMETLSSKLLHDLEAYLLRARNDHRLHFEPAV